MNSILGDDREGPAGVAENAARVRRELAAACRRAGRDPASVRLIAVTKRFAAEHCRAALAAGLTDLGENYADELIAKAEALAGAEPAPTWHMIGPIQRRPVPQLPRTALWVHTLQRLAVVDRFLRTRSDAMPPFLVQVNVGREPQKAGLDPDELGAFLDAALQRAPDLDLRGLMTIPPHTEDPAGARPYFAALRELGEVFTRHTGRPAPELSMGMSHDYTHAIAEGATMIRVGSALFGPRPGV